MNGKERPWLPNFKIAFTFTGEYREKIVRPVCEELLKYGYSKEDVFFDEWHPELFTGVNADTIFREIYHDTSQCIVVFISPNYSDKPWTGNLEWPTVRALINEGAHHRICPLRIDDVDINKIEGLYSSRDVARSVDSMTPAQIAQFIHRWYYIHVLKQSPDAEKSRYNLVPEQPSESEVPLVEKKTAPILEIEAVEAYSPAVHEQAVTVPKSADLTWLPNGNVLFGNYPQTRKGEGRPIEWLVLKREADRALLISRYVLDAKQYSKYLLSFSESWVECSLRKWLNGRNRDDFLQSAFTGEEQKQILMSNVSADQNPYLVTNAGKQIEDKVFLLSITEAKDLFPSDKARRCSPTDYAKKKGAHPDRRYKTDSRPSCWWWLRSYFGSSGYAARVNSDGSIDLNSNNDLDRHDYNNSGYIRINPIWIYISIVGVRPALWIRLGQSGDGSNVIKPASERAESG